jgi:hypothetical protein
MATYARSAKPQTSASVADGRRTTDNDNKQQADNNTKHHVDHGMGFIANVVVRARHYLL